MVLVFRRTTFGLEAHLTVYGRSQFLQGYHRRKSQDCRCNPCSIPTSGISLVTVLDPVAGAKAKPVSARLAGLQSQAEASTICCCSPGCSTPPMPPAEIDDGAAGSPCALATEVGARGTHDDTNVGSALQPTGGAGVGGLACVLSEQFSRHEASGVVLVVVVGGRWP